MASLPPPAPFLRAWFLPPSSSSSSSYPPCVRGSPSSPPLGVKAENPEAGPACVQAGGGGARPARQSLSAARSSQLKCERSGGSGGRGKERPPGSGQGAIEGGDGEGGRGRGREGTSAPSHSLEGRGQPDTPPPPGPPRAGLPRVPLPSPGEWPAEAARAPRTGGRDPARGRSGLRRAAGKEGERGRACVCVCVCVCAHRRASGRESTAGKLRPGPVTTAAAWKLRGGSEAGRAQLCRRPRPARGPRRRESRASSARRAAQRARPCHQAASTVPWSLGACKMTKA